MLSCPEMNCTFLDTFLDDLSFPDYLLFPDELFSEAPLIVADADIAGLGVTTIYSVSLYV